MASVASLSDMKARALAIMATRSQDQHLVAKVSTDLGLKGRESLGKDGSCAVIPSFGWHPWFSHQLYDDTASKPTYKSEEEGDAGAKRAHYEAVLAPILDHEDVAFLESLPTPTPLSSFISSTRELASNYPLALIGEIGLDKAFRLPRPWHDDALQARDNGLTPGGREGRTLSPYRVNMEHQQTILKAQLHLAGELGRPVSVHGVQAHGILLNTVASTWKGHEKEVLSKRQQRNIAIGAEDPDSDSDSNLEDPAAGGKPYPPRICLHSFSASVEVLRQWLDRSFPAAIYFSFSTAVNLGTASSRGKLSDVIKEVPDDRILVESDLHTAGEEMDQALEDMYRLACEIKGWSLEEGVQKVRQNFESFVFG